MRPAWEHRMQGRGPIAGLRPSEPWGGVMFKPVTFEPEVEELVHFIETTPREEIIEATHGKLAAGVPPEDLVRAGTLAVVRSTELPMGHHGGPIHPICGAHAVGQMAKRLPARTPSARWPSAFANPGPSSPSSNS